MKQRKTDRRSTRTHHLLREALVALLLEKRYDAITVQDILDRANIGRATFYEHYWDKEDLLTSQAEWLIESLESQVEASSSPHSLDAPMWFSSLTLLEHISAHYPLYQEFSRGGAVALMTQALQQHLRVQVKTQLQAPWKQNRDTEVLDAVAAYVVGTFMTLVQWWLETDMSWSPHRMEALFRQLMLSGMHQLLEGNT